jgi:hypothetical protein
MRPMMQTLSAAILGAAAASALLACGARTELAAVGGGVGGEGGRACGAPGAACSGDQDCCSAPCTSGACAAPPPACLHDEAPVVLATGLGDPFALGGDAASLFVGQLEKDRQLVRIPKVGGASSVVVDHVSFVDYLTVQDGQVFYSDDHAVNAVPTAGGAPAKLASGSGPEGLAITPARIYLADYLAKQLVEIDRATLASKVLGGGFDGIYRVAATEDAVYFSSFAAGLFRYRPQSGVIDNIAAGLGQPRAVLAYGGSVYYTVPATQEVYRLSSGADQPELIGDLAPLGMFPEALQTDGAHLYLTLVTGQGPGLIVRIPLAGGAAEVVADGGGAQPSALVVDEACVYWTERDGGSVLRARKAPP